MPLQITEQEIKRVRQAVEMELGGRSVGELMESGALGLSRRTLQRRLDLLVKRGDLIARGEGRGRRYFGTAPERERVVVLREEPLPYTMTSAGPDWMSEAAKDIRARVTAPLFERKPVGYQRDFLNAYEPNETFYLPEPERETLHRVGQVKIDELPAGTYLRQVLDRLLIDLSWNSSRLEGNTYSLLETQRLLEEGRSADGKRVEEAQMILNHKAAIEMLADQAEEIGFNAYTICNLHALLSDGLLQDPAAGGRVRTLSVGITGTVFHPLAVPQELERFFQIILEKAAAIRDPFEQAFFMMVQLPYLQPFEDVNKRVSRLAANISLVQRNLCPLSFTDVTQDDYVSALLGVYELNRVDYLRDLFLWAYRRSAERYGAIRQSLGAPDPFRLSHREEIGRIVGEVVREGLDKVAAVRLIREEAEKIVVERERARFMEEVERELTGLHLGSIARFRLRPKEFERWRVGWR